MTASHHIAARNLRIAFIAFTLALTSPSASQAAESSTAQAAIPSTNAAAVPAAAAAPPTQASLDDMLAEEEEIFRQLVKEQQRLGVAIEQTRGRAGMLRKLGAKDRAQEQPQ